MIPPKTNLALRYFWDLLIRDYVDWWFSPLSQDTEFPSACRRSLEFMAASFASHVQSKTPAEMVMLAIMSASSTLIVFFRELCSASLETESATGVAEYIRNNPESALAQMVDEKPQQEKLRYLATRLLATFSKSKDLECEAGRLFAREMLAMQVLNLTAASCSTASYINWYIVETFKQTQEQRGVLAKDSRAKEAEEAMARAVAEAAEMTRMLQLERDGNGFLDDAKVPSIAPPENKDSMPRTTFQSLLQDPEILPRVTTETGELQPRALPRAPDPSEAIEETMRVSSPQSSLTSINESEQPSESPSRSSLQEDESQQETLLGAKITLMDLSADASTGKPIRQRSTLSYMITIEPTSSRVPGWVAIKQFYDFETLHDVLRRLANVGGIRSFPTELPEWKGKLHPLLANELEDYLKTALSTKQLADSETMKRFFGKEITDQSLGKKKAWQPLKGVGEGVRDAMLSSANWATTGINKKKSTVPVTKEKSRTETALKGATKHELLPLEEDTGYHSPLSKLVTSTATAAETDLQRSSTSSSLNGYMFIGDGESTRSASTTSLKFPDRPRSPPSAEDVEPDTPHTLRNASFETQPTISKPASSPSPPLPERPSKGSAAKQMSSELSPNDAQQILDIGFSILSEFYALSPRTWMIRKSLLNLLKSLLISNGRTYIETIRSMIQEDLIKKCLTSDEWLASQVKAITESMWPSKPVPAIDDEAYRIQAKELFLTKMLPETMRGLMGGAATTQALEIVFEALQDQRIAKGIMVALMCDVIRALQV